jgi:hypothetical protein
MLIRRYNESDLDALRRMHAGQGFGYAFPNLADPLFVSKLVVENDDGRPVMASLARLTCEMYLLVDREDETSGGAGKQASLRGPFSAERYLLSGASRDAFTRGEIPRPARNDTSIEGSRDIREHAARERFAYFLALHRAGEQDLLARGLEDAHAWLPPQVARRFGRRLESLGWVRDSAWTPYSRRLKGRD